MIIFHSWSYDIQWLYRYRGNYNLEQNPWDHSSQYSWQSYWTLTKQTLSRPIPSPQINVVNNAETTFGNIPRHKLNIELRERGLLEKGNTIQHGVYHKNMRIWYRGKIGSNSYVHDCKIELRNIIRSNQFTLIELSWQPRRAGSLLPLPSHTHAPTESVFGGGGGSRNRKEE